MIWLNLKTKESFDISRFVLVTRNVDSSLIGWWKLSLMNCLVTLQFQIYIHYDLHDGVEVCAKLSSANDSPKDVGCPDDGTEEHGDRPDEFSYTCNFEYLPPLVLTCLLPLSYPSKDPPYFTATAKWMDGPDVSQLCEMPDNIWAELPGQEVVCQWVEGIRNSSFSYLRFDGKITLGPDIATHKLDNRAISRSLPLESVIPSMLSYSSKKHYEAFLQDFHMCMICLNQTKGGPSFLLCSHTKRLFSFFV